MPETHPIDITDKAVEMAKKKLAAADSDVLGIRLGVRGGGCNGYAYVFELTKKIREKKDQVLDYDGLTIVVDDRSIEFLKGSTLDWEQKLLGYGFKWINPNATGSCGCGESFYF
jgi:iron-sulfur cluster assembly protein